MLHWYDHGFVIATLLLVAGAVRQQKGLAGASFTPREKFTIYFANSLVLWAMALVAIGIWWWGDRPFAEIGICDPDRAAGTGSAILSGLILVAWTIDVALTTRSSSIGETRREWRKTTPFMPESAKEAMGFVPLAFSAGVCEEIVFRGYMIRYFELLSGEQSWSPWAAVLVPAIAFAIGHRYQRRTAMIKIFILALAFGALFVMSGSLLWCALIHFGIDFAAGLISPYLMRESTATVIAPEAPESPPHTPAG